MIIAWFHSSALIWHHIRSDCSYILSWLSCLLLGDILSGEDGRQAEDDPSLWNTIFTKCSGGVSEVLKSLTLRLIL